MNQNEPKWTKMNQNEPKWTKMNQNEPKWTKMNQNEPKWTKMNQNEPNERNEWKKNLPKIEFNGSNISHRISSEFQESLLQFQEVYATSIESCDTFLSVNVEEC